MATLNKGDNDIIIIISLLAVKAIDKREFTLFHSNITYKIHPN